ncbi:MAG: hypothetical protein QGI86_09250 [Candidatus Poribacteria bacterium]|nr:hypothetical protein [Candidatus Poribacteria bacterium]MDP6747830.1 hypothetical protein [Candidatus Poribacteria bacterium]MDP6997863.1 hypothetical protein [Candidatus Poribacteria bacterium]
MSDISFTSINDEGQFWAYLQQLIDRTNRFLWCAHPDRELFFLTPKWSQVKVLSEAPIYKANFAVLSTTVPEGAE